jgi:bifunctional DNA primase/polymerase-like protein
MANNSIQGGLSATISSLAQDCIGQGLPVLPLYNDEKGPNIKGWNTLSLAECQQQWRPRRGIAKLTGLYLSTCSLPAAWGDLFILDIDEYDPDKQAHVLEELLGSPEIPANAVTTASGGLHLYFRWGQEGRGQLSPSMEICGSHIDLRGAGLSGGIVLPPSWAKVTKSSSPYCGEVRGYTGPGDLVGWLGSLPPISERTKEKISSASAVKSQLATPLGRGVSNERMLLGITSQLRRALLFIPDNTIGDGQRNDGAMALGQLVGANSINPRAYSLVRDDVLAMVKPKVDLDGDTDGSTWAKFMDDFERAVGYGHNDFSRNAQRLNSARDEALKGKGQMGRAVLWDSAERLFGGPPLLVIKMRDGAPETYELIIDQPRDTWTEAPKNRRVEFPKSCEGGWMNFVVRDLQLQDQIESSPLDTSEVSRKLLKVLKQNGLVVNLSGSAIDIFLDCLGRELRDSAREAAPLLDSLSKKSKQKPWVELWPQTGIGRKKIAVWIAPDTWDSSRYRVYFTDGWLEKVLQDYCNLNGAALAWVKKNAIVVNARDGKHSARSMDLKLLPAYHTEEIWGNLNEHSKRIRSEEDSCDG